VTVTALTLRFQYVWSGATLWGADIESRLGVTAYADANVQLDVQTPGGKLHRANSARGSSPGGLLAPALLGWHGDTVHQIAGLEFFLPTREFNKTQSANISTGYYSAAPAYWITWLPNDDIEVSGSLVYLFNFKNSETNYRSGQEINLDYGLGYAMTPALQIGFNGYLYRQVTDDVVNGAVAADGNRGRALAIGPFIRYHPSRDWGIALKWQHEYLVENRASGNRFFLQFTLKIW